MGVAGVPPPRTRVRLLGGLEVSVVGLRAAFRSPTSRLAVAALALVRQPVSRARLAALLAEWSGTRVVPVGLAAVAGELTRVFGPDLVAEDGTLALRRGPGLWIDAEVFEAASAPAAPGSVDELVRALDLYGGDLLDGVDVRHDGELAALAAERRAELRDLAAGVARRLARRARRGPVALEAAERLAQLSPCSELDCRLVVKVLAASGRGGQALARYDALARRRAGAGTAAPGPVVRRLATHVDAAHRRSLRQRHPLLPVPDTPTVGRRTDIERVVALATDGMPALVTLTGPGGVGKSRLAVEAAVRVAELRGAASAAVRLGGRTKPVDVLAATARAFGLDAPAGPYAVPELAALLGAVPRVLVLDAGGRPPGPGVHDVARLAARCPNLTVLVASRAPMRVPGERVVPVRPLPVPAPGAAPDEVAASPAVRLFARSAGDPALAADPERAPAVAELCRELDGLPLAIVHAARGWATVAPSRGRPAAPVAAQDRAVEVARASLHALAGSVVEELEDDERRVVEVLAHLPGGADLALVARAASLADRRAATTLRHLADTHVVDAVAGLHGRPTRYVVPGTTAAYLLDAMQRAGRVDGVGRQLRAAVVERLGPDGVDFGSATERQLATLAGEHANLLASLSGAVSSDDRPTAVRIAAALGWYWQVSGHVATGAWWVSRVLGMERSAGWEPGPAEGQLLLAGAMLATRQGDGDAARDHLAAARRCFDAVGEERGLANVELLDTIVSLFGPGAPDVARRAATALELTGDRFAALGDVAGVGRTLHTVALAHALAGEHGRAIDLAGAVAALATGQGNRRLAALAHVVVAVAALFDGDARRALTSARVALRGAWDLRDLVVVRYALAVLPAATVLVDPKAAPRAVLLGTVAADLDERIGVPTPSSCQQRLALVLADAEGALDDTTLRELRRDATLLDLGHAVELAMTHDG